MLEMDARDEKGTLKERTFNITLIGSNLKKKLNNHNHDNNVSISTNN